MLTLSCWPRVSPAGCKSWIASSAQSCPSWLLLFLSKICNYDEMHLWLYVLIYLLFPFNGGMLDCLIFSCSQYILPHNAAAFPSSSTRWQLCCIRIGICNCATIPIIVKFSDLTGMGRVGFTLPNREETPSNIVLLKIRRCTRFSPRGSINCLQR